MESVKVQWGQTCGHLTAHEGARGFQGKRKVSQQVALPSGLCTMKTGSEFEVGCRHKLLEVNSGIVFVSLGTVMIS